MKKKFISVLLGTAMLSTVLTGCGNSSNKEASSSPVASTETEKETTLFSNTFA